MGHVGVLTHRNMSRGTIAHLRDLLQAMRRGEKLVPKSTKNTRIKPKGGKSASPAPQKAEQPKTLDGLYATIRRALKVDLPERTVDHVEE